MNAAAQQKEKIAFLDVKLFDLGATPITTSAIIVMVAVIIAT
jgi:hypothetical protein